MRSVGRKDALRLLQTLKSQASIQISRWPNGLRGELDALQQAGIARIGTPPGRRSPHLVVTNPAKLDARIVSYAGEEPLENMSARAASIHQHGSSKAGASLPYLLLDVLPGLTSWRMDGSLLQMPSGDHLYAGVIMRDGEPSPEPWGHVILIENRESWLGLRDRLPIGLKNASIVHYEGWISARLIEVLKGWSKAVIWIAPDYDPVGFQNYIKLKEVCQDVRMLVPSLTDAEIEQWGSEELWAKQSDYLYTARNWCARNPGPEANFFDQLVRLGMAVEQEFLGGISHLVWNMERVGMCDDEPTRDDPSN